LFETSQNNYILDTQEVMSVLRIAKENGAPEKIIKAKESRPFRIYKKSYGKGDINIPLTIPKANPSTTFILFYGIDPNAARPLACGGEEQVTNYTKLLTIFF
jgi:hypothetical protein